MGEHKRKKEPRPKLKFRGVTWNLPEPVSELMNRARQALIAYRKSKEPGFDIGESDFALHLLAKGSQSVLAEIEQHEAKTRLVQPAVIMPTGGDYVGRRTG